MNLQEIKDKAVTIKLLEALYDELDSLCRRSGFDTLSQLNKESVEVAIDHIEVHLANIKEILKEPLLWKNQQ